MRAELATTIIAAIFGVLIAYFVCNIFVGEIQPVSVKTIDTTVSSTLTDPDPEVFNYKALNPTVEVYVGSCTQYNDAGECIDQVTEEELEDIIDQDIINAKDESQNSTNNQNSNNNPNSTNVQEGSTNSNSTNGQNTNNNQRNQ